MKKFIFATFAAVIMSSASVFTADARKVVEDNELCVLLEKYSKEDGMASMKLKGALLNMARTLADKESKVFMKHVNFMCMFNATEAGDSVKGSLVETLNAYFAAREGSYSKETVENVETPTGVVSNATRWIRVDDTDTIVEMVTFFDALPSVMIVTGDIPLSLLTDSPVMFDGPNSKD